jgi:hypothetical protein
VNTQTGLPQHHRRGPAFWPAVSATGYLVVMGAVVTAEYVSEMAKIARGTFTDTFSPFLFTDLLTYPVSSLHRGWQGYPPQFSAVGYRSAVRASIAPTTLNVLAVVVIIATLVWAGDYVHRRRHDTDRGRATAANLRSDHP